VPSLFKLKLETLISLFLTDYSLNNEAKVIKSSNKKASNISIRGFGIESFF